MEIPLDEVVYFDVITSHPVTGAAADADSTPTFEVFEEATDTDIGVGGNLTKRTSKTGNYRGSFTASAANGFELGKFYSIVVSATVGSVAGKTIAKQFRCIAAEDTAGYKKSTIKNGTGAGELAIASGIVNASLMAINGETPPLDNFYDDYNGNGYAGGTIKKQVDLRQIRGENVPATAATGVPKVAVTHVMTTALTESATGRLAGAFSTMYNVASPVFTAASVNQGADNNVLLPGVSTRVLLALPAVQYDEAGGLRTTNQGTRTIYLASTGNDSNSGLSRSAPKLTPSSARTAARAGDTIRVLDFITITTFTANKRLNWVGDSPITSGFVSSTASNSFTINEAGSGSTFSNLWIQNTGGSPGDSFGACFVEDKTKNITFENVKITNDNGRFGLVLGNFGGGLDHDCYGHRLKNVFAQGYASGIGQYDCACDVDNVYAFGNHSGYYMDASDGDCWLSGNDLTAKIETALAAPPTGPTFSVGTSMHIECHSDNFRNYIDVRNATLLINVTNPSYTAPLGFMLTESGTRLDAIFNGGRCRVMRTDEGLSIGGSTNVKGFSLLNDQAFVTTLGFGREDELTDVGNVQHQSSDIAATKSVVEDEDVGNEAIKDAVEGIDPVVGGQLASLSREAVSNSRTFVLVQKGSGWTTENPLELTAGADPQTFWLELRNHAAVNQTIGTIDSVTVIDGGEVDISDAEDWKVSVFGGGQRAAFNLAVPAVRDYTVRVTGTYYGSLSTFTGDIVFSGT